TALDQPRAERGPLAAGPPAGGPGGFGEGVGWLTGLGVALAAGVCEELAFRGFLLGGLRGRFRPWPPILLSSLFFALYSMNVFQLLPAFLLGVVLGILVLRTRSILPGMAFHLMHRALVSSLAWLPGLFERLGYGGDLSGLRTAWLAAGVIGLVAAA